MEVLKELHAAMTNAYDASFDSAYKHMELHVDALVKEAKSNEASAKQAHMQQEITIRELRHEITALQNELRQYEIDPRDLELPRKYANLETEFDPKSLWDNAPDNDRHLNRKFQKLIEAKYTALYTNLQTFIQTWSGLKTRVLQHKDKLRRWDQQLGREEFTLVLNGQQVKFRRVLNPPPENVDKEHSQATHGSRECPIDEHPDLPDITVRPSLRRISADDEGTVVKADDKQRPTQPLISEPASTQSSPHRPDGEPSEDSDTICSLHNEQPRRKRQRLSPAIPGRKAVPEQRSEISSKRPTIVKEEALPSSPVPIAMHPSEQQPFVSTQDLDDIGDTIQTPMKRKAHRDVYAANTLDSKRISNNIHHSKHDTPGHQVSQQQSILQVANGNAHRAKFSTQGSSSQRLEDLERRRIPALAEDGEDAISFQKSPTNDSVIYPGHPNGGTKCEAGQRRLETLLERSMPSKSPLGSSAQRSISDSMGTDRVPRSDKMTPKMSSQIAPDIDPDDEPFRARPLRCLGLEHFKINPARNEGLDYAYDAVVRKKDDRKCISGCTRPGCCGDRFRAMARLGDLPGKSGPEQKEEDQAILQEFVGEDLQLLQNLSDRERDNLLVEAKARLLANKYGRHRHTHQRAQSPPGFWRTDMPDTQEIEDDLEAARTLEREKVEERYREAMRPGGLWTWADE